jgi:hypothetical protein
VSRNTPFPEPEKDLFREQFSATETAEPIRAQEQTEKLEDNVHTSPQEIRLIPTIPLNTDKPQHREVN